MLRAMLMLVVAAPAAAPRAGADEKRLLGFEKAEVAPWAKPADADGGGYAARGFFRAAPGDATEGRLALVRTLADKYGYLRPGNASTYYVRVRAGRILNAHGWLRRAMPEDWSGWRYLRMDVKIEPVGARLRLELEDEVIDCPVVRRFRVEPGKWTTLQLDLAAAAEQLKLDLKHIATLQLMAVELAERRADVTVRVDNLRLAAAGAAAGRPLVEDRSPLKPAPEPGPKATPMPEMSLAMGPAAPPTGPVVVRRYAGKASYPLLRVKERCIGGFGTAGLLMMDGATGIGLSLDGGRTWTDLAGKAGAVTRVTPDVRGHRMTVHAAGREVMAAMIPHHCAGGGGRTEIHFYRAHHDGRRWIVGPKRVLETGIRHCADRLAMIRDAGGRLWVAWDHLNRLGRYAIHAKFSDDHGRTWRHAGNNGRIREDFRGLPRGPWLVRDGKHVACFWRPPDSPVSWSRFDGETWSAPMKIGRRIQPVSAVSVEGAIYLATINPKQVLRLDGEKWTPDSPPGPGTGLLCGWGDRLVCLWREPADTGQAVRYSVRAPGGKWSAAKTLVVEPAPIEGLAAPQHAPEGFLPVAWADKSRKWIKSACLRGR